MFGVNTSAKAPHALHTAPDSLQLDRFKAIRSLVNKSNVSDVIFILLARAGLVPNKNNPGIFVVYQPPHTDPLFFYYTMIGSVHGLSIFKMNQ